MKAQVGNWLVVHGRNLDDQTREGLVVGVPHADGSPPYLVRWVDDDHVSMVFPGPDATLLTDTPHHRRKLPFAPPSESADVPPPSSGQPA